MVVWWMVSAQAQVVGVRERVTQIEVRLVDGRAVWFEYEAGQTEIIAADGSAPSKDDAARLTRWLDAPPEADDAVAPDPEVVHDLVRSLADALDGADLADLGVEVQVQLGRRDTVDLDGSWTLHPIDRFVMQIHATVDAPDGVVTDQLLFVGRASAVPTADWIVPVVVGHVAMLSGWPDVPVADADYTGPVVLTGAAAAAVFRHALVPRLSRPPGTAVLPPGWGAIDDPTAMEHAPSSYTHDRFGRPAAWRQVVVDGRIDEALPDAIPSNLTVTPPRAWSEARLHRRARRAAAAAGHDHYVRIDRLADPSVSPDRLADPIVAERVARDGTVTPLRGGSLAEIDLMQIVGASGRERHAAIVGTDPAVALLTVPWILVAEGHLDAR